MNQDEFLEELNRLSEAGRNFKPHKYLALLAALELISTGVISSERIYFTAEFRSIFSRLLKRFGNQDDRDRPYTPFFHLRSHPFWKLVAKAGLDDALRSASSVGSPNHLISLVDHAELDPTVFRMLQDPSSSEAIRERIVALLDKGSKSRSADVDQGSADSFSGSLFAHEKAAQEKIANHVKAHRLGVVLTNLQIHDSQSNRYFELDLVLIASFGVFVIELKHWSGRIVIQPNNWIQNNSFFKPDPHKANDFKAKLLKGLCERHFATFPHTYFESVVVFTNPNVWVEGGSVPATSSHNPTFDSIEGFFQYLNHQSRSQGIGMTESQCSLFAEYLKKLQTPSRPKDFVFPGYEIVERLYQHADRAELIARRTDTRYRKLSRLRIFFPSSEESHEERRRAHERATATLNTVTKVGDNPNILKVWSIPNDDGLVIEGSDWSDTGTLRDLLGQEGGKLPIKRAELIASGIAQGLLAIHRESVVHRALKPENILIADDSPKLMNFDLSYQLEDDRLTVIPDTASLKRSPYIAPEIYMGHDIPDGRADLFSLGVILYEMVSGSRPFGCSTDLERSGGKLKREDLLRLELPDHLLELILDLIQLRPDQRPNDAAVVLRRLEQPHPAAIREVNPQLLPGDKKDLYSIEEFVSRGAESQLYRASGVNLKKIALKLFNRDVPQLRIVNEHRLSGAVLHPTIVRVDSYGQWTDERYFIAFDWVSNRTLRDYIREGLRPDLDQFTAVTRQLLNALAVLHGNTDGENNPDPIIHNDIKPENILMADPDRPILIDFGAASKPHVGTYQGTEGYVAPDLRSGEDRKYCIDGDLYALGISLREWLQGSRTVRYQALPEGFPQHISEWLEAACSDDATKRFESARAMGEAFLSPLKPQEPLVIEEEIIEQDTIHPQQAVPEAVVEYSPRPETIEVLKARTQEPNSFVSYLNSLQNTTADTDNALAESQARSPYFNLIRVSHPLAATVEQLLLASPKRNVVITGHAGDGKSTIAVEVLKSLRGQPSDKPLDATLERREDLVSGQTRVSVIKDFSEWNATERSQLMSEMLNPDGPVFFLISNTGTLLDTFKSFEHDQGGDIFGIESDLLRRMSCSGRQDFQFHQRPFTLFNLAMHDNLKVARQIFDKMIHQDRWQTCALQPCRETCPIFQNVQLLRANEAVAKERLFLAYRRIYEYGNRLTLRQISAHLAYLITSGLSFSEISRMSERAKKPPVTDFMFFNRFFGDDGTSVDSRGSQLRAVRIVRAQGFGNRTSPVWERKLWLSSGDHRFQIRAVGLPDDVADLQAIGASRSSKEEALHAREQVRRMLFFLHPFDGSDRTFPTMFLNSPMIRDFARWQEQESDTLPFQESAKMHRRILHVLQEYFTGVRLPEDSPTDRHLFITLSRRSNEVRQSAQVVLARYPEEDFQIRLRTTDKGASTQRRELVLYGPDKAGNADLTLSLPFLDYVMMRSYGEIGGNLQASFLDRLERFKGHLITGAESQKSDDIMLVRLRTNNTFRRHKISVHSGRLEVADA